MSMFRKRRRNVPDLNTSSLPDLIFTVLFFFMIVTHMRDVPLLLKAVVPQGQELVKGGKKNAIITIVIGGDTNKRNLSGSSSNGSYSIQVNDKLTSIDNLAEAIETERRNMSPEEKAEMMVCIRADRETPMHIIARIRSVLRQSYSLKVFYSANEDKAQ